MSLITRCPACETMFKVVPDQLRISEGWVRCGQCNEVFDASAHLIEGQFAGDAGAGGDQQAPALPEVASPPPEVTMPQEDEFVPQEPIEEDVIESAVKTPGWAEAHAQAIEPVLEEFPLPNDVQLPPQGVAVGDAPPDRGREKRSGRVKSSDVSFMRRKKSRSFWRRPLVRAGLMGAGLLLCISLVLQVVVHERDRIAAVAPGLEPLLGAICMPLQCQVSALRRIDAVVIESSSFNKIRGDVYRLNFTLKNTGPVALATPAIELSLTDMQDQPIMRRVFRPAEVGLRTEVIPSNTEASGSLALSVKTNGGADRITGYRVLAFYP